MQIIYTHKFQIRIGLIVDYIAIDSPSNARKFYRNLKNQINDISFMPYRYRKSITADNENITDLIFKGYVVPFFIDKENDTIEILSIYSRNQP